MQRCVIIYHLELIKFIIRALINNWIVRSGFLSRDSWRGITSAITHRNRQRIILGPVHTYPDIFESATFSFRIRLPSTRIQRTRQRIRIFFNPTSRVEKINPQRMDGESGYFRIRWRGKIVSSLLPNNKQCGGTTCRPSFSRVNPDTIGCVWTGEFDLNTLRVDGEIFESEMKKLRIQKYPDTCGRGIIV